MRYSGIVRSIPGVHDPISAENLRSMRLAYWEGERDQYQDLSERVGHTLVLGTTRVGKTRLAEILITQDIHRGDVVIVFDPKGDAELMTRTFVEARKAGRPCYIFHLGYPDISARYKRCR